MRHAWSTRAEAHGTYIGPALRCRAPKLLFPCAFREPAQAHLRFWCCRLRALPPLLGRSRRNSTYSTALSSCGLSVTGPRAPKKRWAIYSERQQFQRLLHPHRCLCPRFTLSRVRDWKCTTSWVPSPTAADIMHSSRPKVAVVLLGAWWRQGAAHGQAAARPHWLG